MSPDDWLEQEVLVVVGTGGVGKTTLAAAIGLEGARRGKRVLVITIDPARRLADALGVDSLGPEPAGVPLEHVPAGGRLEAMMLDTKRTFDRVVARFAPDAQALERIYSNPIYQNLTDALAGSREYSALEELHALWSRHEYDLIVLDTPPARHALEFLEAPRRLTGLLESPLIRVLLRPALVVGRTSFRLFRWGSTMALRTIERVSGLEFLTAISEFVLAFESMLDGFLGRAREIQELLRSPRSGFVLVAGPDVEQARRAASFFERLRAERVRLLGLVANRVRVWPVPGPIPELSELELGRARAWLAGALERAGEQPGEERAERVLEVVARQAACARRDADTLAKLAAQLPLSSGQVRVIPLFDEDVHARAELERLAEVLFASDARG